MQTYTLWGTVLHVWGRVSCRKWSCHIILGYHHRRHPVITDRAVEPSMVSIDPPKRRVIIIYWWHHPHYHKQYFSGNPIFNGIYSNIHFKDKNVFHIFVSSDKANRLLFRRSIVRILWCAPSTFWNFLRKVIGSMRVGVYTVLQVISFIGSNNSLHYVWT